MTRSAKKEFLRVGVTGGIGSGKSTVCAFFVSMGRTVISADQIARDITEGDKSVQEKIRKVFGRDIYLASGEVDRKRLADIVFQDARLKARLNAIVHPVVFDVIDHTLDHLPSDKKIPYVLIEAALIFESGLDKRLDYTIVIDADEETRIARVMTRDGATRQEVLNRISSQMPVKKKLAKADFIIENNSSENELLPKVHFLDSVLRQLVRTPSQ